MKNKVIPIFADSYAISKTIVRGYWTIILISYGCISSEIYCENLIMKFLFNFLIKIVFLCILVVRNHLERVEIVMNILKKKNKNSDYFQK